MLHYAQGQAHRHLTAVFHDTEDGVDRQYPKAHEANYQATPKE